jgi:hypothetical protein
LRFSSNLSKEERGACALRSFHEQRNLRES